MCGRFTLSIDPADLIDAFPEFNFPSHFEPRYNIAPTQPIMVLPNDGTNRADFYIWGLIPSWAKDPAIGSRLINARAETLAEKPAFRSAYKYHRCLIFADGFFEWQSLGNSKSKIPHLIRLRTGRPFAFAGLWERWQPSEGSEVKSAAIITTSPNDLMAPIHNRMPVILPEGAYQRWLDSNPQSPAMLDHLLIPYPSKAMQAWPISTLINNPANDWPDVLATA